MSRSIVQILRATAVALSLSMATALYAQESGAADFPGAVELDNSSDNETNEADLFIMDDMNVIERVDVKAEVGKTEIPREMIQYMPKGNGNVTDLLRAAPGVQYNENYRSSENAAEIAPAEISISGGKFYENLFIIDGMSNSNILDPASSDPYSKDHVASNSQKFFIDSWLIEDVTVYDSNIPVDYDGFTGGVVDVKIRLPKNRFSGRFSYKRTSSSWVQYYSGDSSYTNNGDGSSRPKFEKNYFSGTLDIPISAKTATTFSYTRKQSVSPVRYFNKWKDRFMLEQNLYLKGVHNIDGANYIDASIGYSPNESSYYLDDVKDSKFKIKGGGYFTTVGYNRETGSGGSISVGTNYAYSENSRRSPADYKGWLATENKPWGLGSAEPGKISMSNEGGAGDIDEESNSFGLNFTQKFAPVDFLGDHKTRYGLVYNYNRGRYHRLADSMNYNGVTQYIDVICNGDTGVCVDGEQYLSERIVSPESDVTASVNTYALFIEDVWSPVNRLNLRLSARLTDDDYMKNVNLSPRTQASYDVFGNKFTVLTAGYNRYYSASLLANKMREGMLPVRVEKRWTHYNEVQPWSEDTLTAKATYNFAELNTPYTDEYTAAVDQDIFGSHLIVNYTERQGRDEFAEERYTKPGDDVVYYRLNNNGRSKYTTVQIRWAKNWQNHALMLSTSWQESKTSNNSYDDSVALEVLERPIIVDGKKIALHDKPRDNYNRPYILNISYMGRFFDHLILSLYGRYQTSYKALEVVNSSYFLGYGVPDPVTGAENKITTLAYETVKYGDTFTMDASISWQQVFAQRHTVIATLEIDNLLNLKNAIGAGNQKSYELGRQFWASISYEF